MSKNWIGMIVLVGASLVAGSFFSQIWEQVLGQPPVGFSAEPPQVVVNQPAVLPKWCVDFVPLPPLPGESQPRFRVITVVDTETKKIAVYHLNITTGELWWLSTRDIQPDLMVNQFNATSPLPSDIRQELQLIQGQK